MPPASAVREQSQTQGKGSRCTGRKATILACRRGLADLRPTGGQVFHPRSVRRIPSLFSRLPDAPGTWRTGHSADHCYRSPSTRVIFRYIRALLTDVPMLARMIKREASELFDLSNGVSIEVATASYRSIRGYTIVAALCDEIAFWPTDDSAQPDYEILDAIRPGMATIPGALLLCASSPYARRGALWTAHRQHFGRDGSPILVWQADTRTIVSTVSKYVIAAAEERDPASAAARRWRAVPQRC